MNDFFRRQSLSFKLILIGIIPLAFIIYLTFEVYKEKSRRIAGIEGAIKRVDQVGDMISLIHQMQQEQKISFDCVKKTEGKAQLIQQRKRTDSALQKLRNSDNPSVNGLEQFTSLKNLQDARNKQDSGLFNADKIIHFYSAAIFRLNTLISISYNSQSVLAPFYKDIESQKLITEITTYLAIIRTNIYNVLTTRQYMMEVLFGTLDSYEVYKSYDTELRVKASPVALAAYKRMAGSSNVKPALDYIDKLFTTFKFDSTYNAEQWWSASENALQQLLSFRETLRKQVNKSIEAVHAREVNNRDWTLVLLILIAVIVLGVIGYTISLITSMLSELKTGAEKIALGGTGSPFNIHSKDAIGSLAESIYKIAENNHELSIAANEIGKGNFHAPVKARSEDDILGNAIISMKNNLQSTIEALAESETGFKQLADLMPQIVWTTDATGKANYFNKQWIEYCGSLAMTEMLHPIEAGEVLARWENAVKEGSDFVMEFRMQHYATKKYRWFLTRAIPVKDGQGKIRKWFGTSTDIHDRKSSSEALEKLVQKRTMELKRSNEELTQFAHVASHDMKEPLRKISVFSGMLMGELAGTVTGKTKTYVDKINSASERMILLIDGVLKYSSINSDDRSFENVDLNKIIEQIVDDLEVTIQQKQAVINWEKLPAIKGIPVLIHQLFFNLIANALKFSRPDMMPVISVTAGIVKQKDVQTGESLSGYDSYLQVNVEDNGIGFSEDLSSKVFDVFVRLNAADKYEGTGLGLALCKKIMERHEGSISVKSKEGKGSCFSLLFPETMLIESRNIEMNEPGKII